jgi:hypothetical protein
MNLYLHGLDNAKVTYGQDSLAQDPTDKLLQAWVE